ncbi:MAG: hypothetical protein VKK04_14130 [Synechococcales bacterium]|nr:hypothetical protein [Synechococcales bacterium]
MPFSETPQTAPDGLPVSAEEILVTQAANLELDPAILEDSPVLQRWLEEIPDVLEDIRTDPSFRTRLRIGYSRVPTSDEDGLIVGVEDVFIGRTGLTLNADYQGDLGGDRHSFGGDLRYYALPLGGYVNLGPVLGYRRVDTGGDRADGVNLGLRLLFVPSRTGAADIALMQTWVNPGSDDQGASLSTLSVGYAVTRQLRLASEIQVQVLPDDQDTRFSVLLEWMP